MVGRWISALRARLRALVGPGRSDRELNDELSFHVAMAIQANVASGMSPAEAERRARLELGGMQQLRRTCAINARSRGSITSFRI